MDDRAARMERRFKWPVLIAALCVVPVIALEESPLGEPWDTIATVGNWAIDVGLVQGTSPAADSPFRRA